MFLAISLISIGVVYLSIHLGVFPAAYGNLIWPVVAVFAGVWLLMKRDGGSFNDLFKK